MGSSASLDRSPRENWTERAGGLPAYVREVARAIERGGKTLSRAIGIAIGRIKAWRTDPNVTAETRAKAVKAIAEWDALKAKNAGRKVTEAAAGDGALRDVADLVLEAEFARATGERLGVELGDDLTVLAGAARRVAEAASQPAESRAKRRAGESLTDYGKRLKRRDGQIERGREAAKKAKTRDGKSADFEKEHPRGRGGAWILKAGGGQQDEQAVRAVQRKVGAGADGKFGGKTRAAVMAFQRKNGLTVDGVVGAQTAAALLGRKDAAKVKVGKASAADLQRLKERGKKKADGTSRRRVREALAHLPAVELDSDELARLG